MKAKTAAPKKSIRPMPKPADLVENFNLERAMRGTQAKSDAEDLRAGKEAKAAGYKKGGCVMAGRGGSYKGMK